MTQPLKLKPARLIRYNELYLVDLVIEEFGTIFDMYRSRFGTNDAITYRYFGLKNSFKYPFDLKTLVHIR